MTRLADLATDLKAVELAQRIDAMRADLQAGLVPPDAHRPLFTHELTARTNFAEIDKHVAAQADYLTRRAKADRQRFLHLLDRDLRSTATRPGPASPLARIANRLFDLDGPGGLSQLDGADQVLAESEIYHRGRLELAAQRAARQVITEAQAQGLPVAEDLLVKLEELQADQLDLLARRLAQAPHVDLLRALRDQVVLEPKDFVTADELVDRLGAHARTLSAAPLADNAASAVQQADAIGRVAAASSLPTPKVVYASELLDGHTCGPCSLVDGHEYASMTEARADYPHGTYVRCEGGLRCRGTLVFVWPTEADPTLQTPGDTTPAPTPGDGGAVHPAARLHVPLADSGNDARDRTARELGDVLAIIGRLHQLPAEAAAIPVRLSPDLGTTRGANGLHTARRLGRSQEIQVWTEGEHAGFTFAHETGHYLDWEAIGGFGTFASESGLLPDVFAAIDASDAVARFKAIALERPSTAQEIGDYWLSKPELWARAYSQWVAERSGDRALIGAARRIASSGPMQWSEADFAPIGQAIDAAMAPLGFEP